MKVFITYPDLPEQPNKKYVHCYYSWDTLEPSQQFNDGHAQNPRKMVIQSTEKDARSGKEVFERPFLFMTFEPQLDCRISINVQFR